MKAKSDYNTCKICGCKRTEMIQVGQICRECFMAKKYEASKKRQQAAKQRNKGNEALRIAKIKNTWDRKSGNITIEPTDPFLSPKCHRCKKNPATEEHTCPYATDILDDHGTLCDCCDDCCQECADDI